MKMNWVQIGNGRIAVGHRPKRIHIPSFKGAGCTHVVTLLSEREDAAEVGELVIGHDMEWIWLPVPEGNPPQGWIHDMIAETIPVVSNILDEGASVLIHCSAGIHRTGMFAYALLRFRGFTAQNAMQHIGSIRSDTALGLKSEHVAWGDQFANSAP